MQYGQAVETLTSREVLVDVMMALIAVAVLFLLAGQVAKLWRDLFGKPREQKDDAYASHLRESEKRFREGEQHIKENHEAILDLKEGLRMSCIANRALLNHAIHDGNDDEMRKASEGLDSYLINRK